MTTGHDAAMFGSGKGGNISDCNWVVFPLPLLHCKPLQNAVASNSPLMLPAVSLSGFWTGRAVGILGFAWCQLGDGLEDSFPQWLLHWLGRHLGAPWPLHIMSNSPRPFCVAWAGGGLRLVLWWLGFKRQKSEDAKPVEGCARTGTTSFPPQSTCQSSHRPCTGKSTWETTSLRGTCKATLQKSLLGGRRLWPLLENKICRNWHMNYPLTRRLLTISHLQVLWLRSSVLALKEHCLVG